MTFDKLKPIGEFVIIKPIEPVNTTPGGLIIEKPLKAQRIGTIVATAEYEHDIDYGLDMLSKVKPGMLVRYIISDKDTQFKYKDVLLDEVEFSHIRSIVADDMESVYYEF